MLGLWPFRSPENQVSWLKNQNGIRFGRYGTVVSSTYFDALDPLRPEAERSRTQGATVEIWLQPRRIWDSGSFLSFYKKRDPLLFSLHQSQLDLEVQTRDTRLPNSTLSVKGIFSILRPVFLTVTTQRHGVWVYADGHLVAAAPAFALSPADLANHLVLGNSPGQGDPWPGQLFGLAVYEHGFTPEEVLNNYAAWKRTGHPEIGLSHSARATYLFTERSGTVIHDTSGSSVNLLIPSKYQVMDKVFLEPFWTEFSMTRSYWSAVLKNVVGFIPFGFCFYPWVRTLRAKRHAALLTVLMGTATSLTIELLQYCLPTRESGTSDLITNTLGTYLGVMFYRFLAGLLSRFFILGALVPNHD